MLWPPSGAIGLVAPVMLGDGSIKSEPADAVLTVGRLPAGPVRGVDPDQPTGKDWK